MSFGHLDVVSETPGRVLPRSHSLLTSLGTAYIHHPSYSTDHPLHSELCPFCTTFSAPSAYSIPVPLQHLHLSTYMYMYRPASSRSMRAFHFTFLHSSFYIYHFSHYAFTSLSLSIHICQFIVNQSHIPKLGVSISTYQSLLTLISRKR